MEFTNPIVRRLLITDGTLSIVIEIDSATGKPQLVIDGGPNGKIVLGFGFISQPIFDIYTPNGEVWGIDAVDNDINLHLQPEQAGRSEFRFIDGEGILFQVGGSGSGRRSVLFDDNSGFLKSGTYSPWTEEDWTTIPANNSWVGGSYKLFSDGNVLLDGNVTSGTQTSGIVVGTLPAGYRPRAAGEWMVARSGVFGTSKIRVNTDGTIQLFVNDAVWNAYLSGIIFSTLA